ncbi:TetR/AcrR family transcriptional regulator [Wenzhouxiangella sediminis]|uniref:TetR/AcrR family transcriptional regulator n=1 Tax=Wenzhouxiangella sediminis TaxID=1792836 RepID=A0A3E1K9Y0_9GAMM|nr:TetR/AcrR family transcriptional regulator [Wenzhouxiangella sediminis]RFF31084.1 TetR/AcrR family transcriptional regulator [Wenzhouxiangella sediminis]
MGTQERKAREFAAREDLFLDTARQLILSDGLLSLTMARVAAACDYATGTLYQHFSSKEDLLLALSTRMAGDRVALFCRAAAFDGATRDRMFALSVADVLFAKQCPEHFRLAQYVFTEAVWSATSDARRQAALEGSQPMCEEVRSIIRQAVADGDLPDRGLRNLDLGVGPWTLCLGMHTLVHADGLLSFYDVNRPYGLLLQHIEFLLNGLGWKPLVDDISASHVAAKVERLCREVFSDVCDHQGLEDLLSDPGHISQSPI